MDSKVIKKYIRAGKIAKKALQEAKKACGVGVSYLDLAERAEDVIYEHGAKPAFPTNISVNSVGAHYTPVEDDENVFEKGDLVKIDIGCHVDGYIADNAETVEIESNRHTSLIKASEEALEIAIKTIRPGVRTRDIGKNIENVIQDRGFNPISNLTGHELKQYVLHSGTSIPNVPKGWKKIKKGMVLAVEPFATDGRGRVKEEYAGDIYRLKKKRNLEGKDLDFYEWIDENFDKLPFAGRWCKKYGKNYRESLERLRRFGSVMNYPVLVEKKKGLISQKEHTVIVTSKGCKVTTKI
ncbi:MAG: type II methionyl aminopeptidase [Candidatus Thermoplasmatota archaeon]|nr:type II methionyl aminopeptidase [Candidatus Thermoplasmatota archaeon]MBS3790243.1 type II methionyl aminopeptidase [Candidatus Thermoplasmatota archaeon]